ncbi:hypothetical protein H1230_20250 [Paenibacillus sp. 19GGS1-52]|uniref:hypothetical protein n=1 Tax=Paenibacillus sp. 19GGS1-52 TaxID=2758563 RepID=UPI001EFB5A79|nr:hypothetical protein [Paenibacillus sp. 19GGS1-52]ULO05411.1 hypothetical protein H1230_20250 [Paenibacillus sp. 19GGS1-52]
MRDHGMEWLGTYEPFHIMLNDYRVANIVITDFARSRYVERISVEVRVDGDVVAWIWQCLKQKRIQSYSNSEQNAYLIDEDLVIIAEFTELPGETNLSGYPLYTLTVVSFLGKVSVTPQLRDLKSYYSLLRHSRRLKLIKRRRRRK